MAKKYPPHWGENAALIAIVIACIASAWGLASMFADLTKNYEVVEPETGVHCIVVSRIFNTSVDCWRL